MEGATTSGPRHATRNVWPCAYDRVFAVRPTLWFVALLVALAIPVPFKSLAALTDRRY